MHAAHFHPPRPVTATLIAALLTIVITLAIASAVNDRSAGGVAPARPSTPIARVIPTIPVTPRPASSHTVAAPAWLRSPFSPLLGGPIAPMFGGPLVGSPITPRLKVPSGT